MTTLLDAVLDDLSAEGDALEVMVTDLDDEAWRTPTPAAGWDVATQVVHLAWTDEVAVAAATDKEKWDAYVLQAIGDPTGYVDAEALRGAQEPPATILARWRAARPALQRALRTFPDGEKLPWFGPPMSPTSMATARYMETWAHSLDVAEALGLAPEPTDRIRHVAHLGVRTRNFAFGVHGLEPPAEAAQPVRGSAYDFCLRVTQRRHRDDLDLVAAGPDADRWLDLAQAFAGPPGEGRSPR